MRIQHKNTGLFFIQQQIIPVWPPVEQTIAVLWFLCSVLFSGGNIYKTVI